ncbi:hypothetical protein B0H16DRAFT_1454567 [Mycena metata]|uniref:Uncharacterized protein n=1 Tax=Mycena metata TaxID=1033252 RepID=A0AAD7JJL1_9AGAR|nr:hypothetical protein B0H16DRAFT_1454567 [Mycena metata]
MLTDKGGGGWWLYDTADAEGWWGEVGVAQVTRRGVDAGRLAMARTVNEQLPGCDQKILEKQRKDVPRFSQASEIVPHYRQGASSAGSKRHRSQMGAVSQCSVYGRHTSDDVGHVARADDAGQYVDAGRCPPKRGDMDSGDLFEEKEMSTRRKRKKKKKNRKEGKKYALCALNVQGGRVMDSHGFVDLLRAWWPCKVNVRSINLHGRCTGCAGQMCTTEGRGGCAERSGSVQGGAEGGGGEKGTKRGEERGRIVEKEEGRGKRKGKGKCKNKTKMQGEDFHFSTPTLPRNLWGRFVAHRTVVDGGEKTDVAIRACTATPLSDSTGTAGGWAKTLVVATVGKGGVKKKKEKTGSQYTGSQRPGHKT